MLSYFRHILKKYFQVYWLRSRYSAQVQIAQRQLFHFYQLHHSEKDKINIANAGFRVFSQFEEDGKVLFILACIGMKTYSFVEIGSDDGLNSNCANLAFNWNYHGLFIDANQHAIARGEYFYKRYPHPFMHRPVFHRAKVTRENINDIIRSHGFTGDVDVLSIDIDGNDYWIWDALEVISPRIVIIETHNIYGMEDKVVPYDPDYVFPGKHPQYHGASPVAMVKLAHKKGYRLVGANQLGFNFIFLRNDEGVGLLDEVSIESIIYHPGVIVEEVNEEVKKWKYE